MNQGLSTVDLGRLLGDEQSFLGQTLRMGIEYKLLPENADEAVRMYLQTWTMASGQRNRTGIALGREEIEQGGFQATVCLELGLQEVAGGDANRAVEILAEGDFEKIRQTGWERAFFRLKEMQEEAGLFPKSRQAAFLQDYAIPVRRWAAGEPETWLSHEPEDSDGPTILDPIREFETFQDLLLRIDLLKALPQDALKRYGSAAGGPGPFTDLFRNLLLSLTIGLDSLVPDEPALARFLDFIVAAAGESKSIDRIVIPQIESQVSDLADSGAQARFLVDMREEIDALVLLPTETLIGRFVVTAG